MRAAILGAGLIALGVPAFAEVAHGEGDPWCDMLEMGEGMVDCALEAGGLILFFDYEESASADAMLTVLQSTPEGGSRTVSEPIEIWDVAVSPGLRDVSGDGVEELFIPVGSGMVNVQFQIWQAGADGFFSYAGALEGFGVDAFDVTEDGLVIGTVRDNAATFIESAYRIADGEMVSAYDLVVDYAEQACSFMTDAPLPEGLDGDAILAACEDREW